MKNIIHSWGPHDKTSCNAQIYIDNKFSIYFKYLFIYLKYCLHATFSRI